MRLGLRAIIELENTFDDAIQIDGNRDWPYATAIGAGFVLVSPQFRTKRSVERLNDTSQLYDAARRVLAQGLKFVPSRERSKLLDISC